MNNPSLCAAALVAASLCSPARAQTGPTDPTSEADAEIIVTGTRASVPTRVDQNGGAITCGDQHVVGAEGHLVRTHPHHERPTARRPGAPRA